MSIEAEALLQEAKESIEAAQNYRSELQQRLHGLNQGRKQVRLWLSALVTEEEIGFQQQAMCQSSPKLLWSVTQ